MHNFHNNIIFYAPTAPKTIPKTKKTVPECILMTNDTTIIFPSPLPHTFLSRPPILPTNRYEQKRKEKKMSPFFLNGPETAARQSAPTSRQSLLLKSPSSLSPILPFLTKPLTNHLTNFLTAYHSLRRRAPTAPSSTESELSPGPELQSPVTLPPKATPSRLEIMLNLPTPAPDKPVTTEGLIAIPKKHPGRASKIPLKMRANREVKAKGERKEKGIGRVEEGPGVGKVLAMRSS